MPNTNIKYNVNICTQLLIEITHLMIINTTTATHDLRSKYNYVSLKKGTDKIKFSYS